MQRRALILGAGPAGLVAAWKLLEQNWQVEIYEKLDRVGGMCRTWDWQGFKVDTGPHIYHTPDANLASFWEEHFGDLWVKGEFWCKNVKGKNFDQYFDYPLSYESISNYPSDLKAKIIHELSDRKPEQKARAKSYREYMEAEVGPTLRELFFEKYPQKIWGIPTDKMTAEWAPKRIEIRQKITPFYYRQWNAVGKYGTGCVYERIAEKIKQLGGKIHLNAEISGIQSKGNSLSALELKKSSPVSLTPDDVVISSLPITLTAYFLGYKSSLQFRGIRSIYLAYNQPTVLPQGIHWLYYDSEKLLFNRVTESKKLSPYVAPEDKTYLTYEVTYSRGDEIDAMSDSEILEKVGAQAELANLGKRSNVIAGAVNKEPFVYPLQFAGYQQELANTRKTISQYQQLYSVGTGGDFNYADSQILFHKAFDTVAIICDKDSSFSQVVRRTPRVNLNKTVQLRDKRVGQGHKAYIIAEAGLNHNGSIEIAKQLVDEAVKAGCEAIKFQTFAKGSRISNKVKSVKYAETITGLEETMFEMFDRLSMPFAEQKIVFEYAKSKGIEVFSTPFDTESVDLLESVGVGLYKIASMDVVNIPLIDYVARTGKPIILSTGMSTLGQIEEAVETVMQAGNENLMLLHCNSSYPAAPSEMNLKVIQTLQKAFQIPVGLSDHTFGITVAHTAIAIGAHLIERHFTLDRTMEGPDHILSSEPEEMRKLVEISHQIPQILGDGVKRIQPNEFDTINRQRKSLYARTDIREGEVFSKENLIIKGPGGGLLPRYYPIVLGRVARGNIDADHPITWEKI